MWTGEKLDAVCIVCLTPAGEDFQKLSIDLGDDSYLCRACPDCWPNIKREDRATYSVHLPRAAANLKKILLPNV